MADWSALGNMVSGMIPLYAKEGSQAYNYGQQVNSAFQEQQIQEAVRAEQKKREKAKKAGMFGKIGATLGTIGGAALAPLTGGASLLIPAALGAAGGAVGGAAGQAIGGGKVGVGDLLGYGVDGAVGGYSGASGAGFGRSGIDYTGMLDQSISGPIKATAGGIAKNTFANMTNMGGVANRGGATPLKKFRLNPDTGEYEYVPGGGY